MTPLTGISSMATKKVLAEMADAFLRSGGTSASIEAVGGVDAAKRVRAGERFDVVVLASTVIEKLAAEGHLVAGSRVDIVRSGVAVAVRAGAPRPEIGSESALKHAVRRARNLSYSTGPSGDYLVSLFDRWGIAGEIAGRIVVPPPGTPVGSLVADGTVELGFQQLSELLFLPGIDVLGPLPAPIQHLTTFSAGVGARSTRADEARALLAFFASPATADIKRRNGMETA
ncbi:MAG: substrate-binding domain-containing protein [Burkholderiales bacterium]